MDNIRAQFPILSSTVYNKPLVYLDNAATTQKPQCVIDALVEYYQSYNSNIHRGAHFLANKATEKYEDSRVTIANFINANSEEINFTKGTTESINLLTYSWGRKFIKDGDEIIISAMEHHANIVPWQVLCAERNADLKVIPINDAGEIILEEYYKLLSPKTKIVSVSYVSNALGTINPIQDIIARAHQVGALVHIDAAQAIQHTPIDVQALDCDFMSFSGHKLYGPMGIGVFYGKAALLKKMNPYMTGGEMIKEVRFEQTTFNDIPFKFSAGTPNVADAIALGVAVEWIQQIGFGYIQQKEQELLEYATLEIDKIQGVKIIGTSAKKSSVLSFIVEGKHAYDIGVLLDKFGVAIRTGHHCCQPLMMRLGIEGTCRASFSFYNTIDEVDYFIISLKKVLEML
jgi:cysteine desulfurase / selenocysteine lyase